MAQFRIDWQRSTREKATKTKNLNAAKQPFVWFSRLSVETLWKQILWLVAHLSAQRALLALHKIPQPMISPY
jgi:hypothetical protein